MGILPCIQSIWKIYTFSLAVPSNYILELLLFFFLFFLKVQKFFKTIWDKYKYKEYVSSNLTRVLNLIFFFFSFSLLWAFIIYWPIHHIQYNLHVSFVIAYRPCRTLNIAFLHWASFCCILHLFFLFITFVKLPHIRFVFFFMLHWQYNSDPFIFLCNHGLFHGKTECIWP